MKNIYVVVGAGLAGASAARILAEADKRVLVIERLRHVAGHAYDEFDENGILIHKYGPHIFHTKEKKVFDFVSKFTNWHYYQHRVLSYVDGMLVPFPINRDTINSLFGVNISTSQVEEFLKKEVESSDFNDPPQNFEDAVISQVGRRLYEKFFKNYTIKQWNRDPRELSADIARRIPTRSNRDGRYFSDRYQGLPKFGYTKMVENILNHPNISLLTNCDYFEIKDELKPNLTVYTGELDKFFDYSNGELEYRSLELIFETLEETQHQQVAVVNYPNDYDWTRITEFKLITGQRSNKTVLCYEYPKDKGEPYYIVMSEENMKKRAMYMKEVEKLEKSGEYLFVGRLAEYKYYNMDQVILASMEKISRWLKGYSRKSRVK